MTTRGNRQKGDILKNVGATPRGCPMLDPRHGRAAQMRDGVEPVLISRSLAYDGIRTPPREYHAAGCRSPYVRGTQGA